MIALFMLLAAVAPVKLSYTGPADGKPAGLGAYAFTTYDPGMSVCAATDEANLRAEANTKAAVVTKLRLGTRLTVVSAGADPVMLDKRVDRWYQVKAADKTGWLFGAALTPLCFEADLDDDRVKEVATVAFTWDFKIRVRVLEPNGEGDHRVTSTALTPAGEALLGLRGGNVNAVLVPGNLAGLPLIRLDSRPEACGDFWIAYVSHLQRPTRTAIAIQAHGMSDPPVNSGVEVTFEPSTKRATLVRTNDDGESPVRTTKTLLTLVGGVFVGDDEKAAIDVRTWPRMRADALGCLLEKELDHHDKRFNCALKDYKNKGDPCKATTAYYEGPEFPQDKAQAIHRLVHGIRLQWEHGEARAVSVSLAGAPNDDFILRLFALNPQPQNIADVSIQDCGNNMRCLRLTGFDHMGAGDVDCPQ